MTTRYWIAIGAFVVVLGFVYTWWAALLAIIVTALMLGVERLPEKAAVQAFVDYYKFVLVSCVLIVTVVVIDSDAKAQVEFFAVAAQIIPVLLLAFVFEAKMLRAFEDPGDLLMAVVVLAMLAAGEYYALRPLVDGSTQAGHVAEVVAAIAAGFTGVVAGAFGLPARASESDVPPSSEVPPESEC